MPSRNGTPKACVIGFPVRHSRSPLIHKFWLDHYGIRGSYERAEIPPDDFPRFIDCFTALGYVGANVTLPHKQAAFERCARRTATAARLKAVNTLWFESAGLCGDNTDAAGFLAALDQDAPGWDAFPAHAVVLGAGGAARAIAYALQLRCAARITLINRTQARAEVIAADLGSPVEAAGISALPRLLSEASLLVNTTSLGMLGQPPLLLDLSPLPEESAICDIVYIPLETGLVKSAKARGLKAVTGISMLLHQAVPGFERWFGVRPSVTKELRRIIEADIPAAV